MANSWTRAELKNCKLLKSPISYCGLLAVYLGSDKRRVLNPCVTFVKHLQTRRQDFSHEMAHTVTGGSSFKRSYCWLKKWSLYRWGGLSLRCSIAGYWPVKHLHTLFTH